MLAQYGRCRIRSFLPCVTMRLPHFIYPDLTNFKYYPGRAWFIALSTGPGGGSSPPTTARQIFCRYILIILASKTRALSILTI